MTDISPRGKYRLTHGQAAIVLALARRPYTARDLERAHEVLDLAIPKRKVSNHIRGCLKALERLGLIERLSLSPHRFVFRLTREGHIDAAARS